LSWREFQSGPWKGNMAEYSHMGELARELTVVYADLSVQRRPQDIGPSIDMTFMLWPRQACDAANDSRLLLQREMIDLAQRNLNASFSFLRRLAGAKNLGEMIELQAIHFSNRVDAAAGQSEELVILSIKAALEFARCVYPGQSHA
jgi:hypothetical protein